ncbi:hypothetical protein [Actinocatenispora rupis]|uniref:Uncharacterized protein n=1 Tax=Actinocatenispora rupis TaxID=519421 RepID=A0A8J3J3J9_9ACTN|nr:hypothetical protein [Actinocatenispora rupis]GID11455.1 hypothetical protein Aru02nite_23440 [Actinocatenispora rupis]
MDTTIEDTADAVRLLGGEVLAGSDADGADRYGGWLLALVGAALPDRGRVLVAGRHDDSLLTALADRGLAVDLVLRNLPDARAARTRLAASGVRVLCGGLDRLPPDGSGYAAVIALDDPAALYGPDSPPRRWADTVALLAALAAPGAPALLLVRNGLGLDRLTGVAAASDTDVPPGLAAVRTALAAAGLRTGSVLAAYPGLVAEETALAAAGDGVASLVAAACLPGPAPVLTDPAPLARDAVRHGLGVALAPAWVVLTCRADDDRPTPTAAPTARPGIVLADRGVPDFWAVPQLLQRDADGGWRRAPLSADTAPRALDHLTRDPSTLDGPVPAGVPLRDLLVAAAAADDLVTARELVRAYREWLLADGTDGDWRAVWAGDETGHGPLAAPGKAVADLSGVLLGPDGPALADPSWSTTLAVPVDLVFLRALQRFCYELVAGGHRHPWPVGVSPDRLAVTLAATAGVAVSARDLAAAAAYAVHLDEPRAPADGGDAKRYAELRERWSADPGHGTVPPTGYAEAVRLVGSLTAELADARAQIRWLDDSVAERDRRLGELGTLRRSVTYRIGYLFTFPFHIGIRLLRREMRRLRS